MSLPSRHSLHGLAALLALAILPTAFAQPAPGQWTRSRGGVVIDVLDLTPKQGGYAIALREGIGRPVYASGFCTAACDKTTCAVRSASGKTGLVELTSRGAGLHYRSFYDDGATVWEGDFARTQGTSAPAPAAPPALAASQWTRSEGGAVIDVLDLTPQGSGYQIALREGYGRPVYSSGTCTIAGDTVTCSSRTTSGKVGQIVLTLRGDRLHYRSSYDQGRSTWEGDFVRATSGR